jgi:excisionase family DNA binding protein
MNKLMTTKELCEYLNVSRMTIVRMRSERGLPYIKKGRNVYFVLKDVERWLGENNKEVKYNYD